MDVDVRRGRWSTALPDWRARILAGQSLVPDLPLFDGMAAKALRVFRRLKVPDMAGYPTRGEVCAEWQFDMVRAIFGSYDPAARQRMISECLLMVPKGNDKSGFASAVILTAAILNERPNAEMTLIGPRQEIALRDYQMIEQMIRLDEDLDRIFHCTPHLKLIRRIAVDQMPGCSISVKSADAGIVTGGKSVFTLCEELHELSLQPNFPAIMAELRGALGKRSDGFLLMITTQSKAPPVGVFEAELAKARKVRDGLIELPMLAVLYELPIEMTIDGGWKDERLWPLVNPNFGRSVRPDFLRTRLAQAEEMGFEEMALVASQHFNVEVGTGLHANGWPAATYWDASGQPAEEPRTLANLIEHCDVCTVGVDGGGLDDLAALAVIGRDRETRQWRHWVRVWAQPDVLDRRKHIASLLRSFEGHGDLVICSAPEQHFIEQADIVDQLDGAGLLPERRAVGVDTAGIRILIEELDFRGYHTGDSDAQVIGIPQGYRLQPAILQVPILLKAGRMIHSRQPVMAWAVGNAKIEIKGSAQLITKQSAGPAKIDPVMATLNAAMLMMLNPTASGAIPKSYLESSPLMVL